MTPFNVYAAATISVLGFASLAGCKPALRSSAPVHALPVASRSIQLSEPPASPAIDSASLAIIHVRGLTLYHQAQQACAAKRYSHAADLLVELSHTPGLSPDETKFAIAQANLCRKDAGLRPFSDRDSVSNKHTLLPNSQRQVPYRAERSEGAAEGTPNTYSDCGPRALAIACSKLGLKSDIDALRKSARTTKDGTTMEGLANAARSLGLKAEGIQTGRDALARLQLPAIAWYRGNHYIAVLELRGGPGDAGTAVIHDPNEPGVTTISQESLLRRSSGYLLTLHR